MSRGRRFIPALILVCLSLILSPPLRAEPGREIGGVPDAEAFRIPPLDFDISLTWGYTIFSAADISDTYDGLYATGLEASASMGGENRFFMAVSRGRTGGNPHYDSPTYTGGDDQDLLYVPVSMGLKVNLSMNPRFRVYAGAAVQLARVEEDVPDPDSPVAGATRTDSGWARGAVFTLAPHWVSRGGAWALGFEFGLCNCSGEVGDGYDRRDVNLAGVSTSLRITRAF